MERTEQHVYGEWLVLRAQAGESAAFDELVRRWHPKLARLARQLCADRASALDAVQEGWIAIVRGLRRLNDPARFGPWAFRIITHKCADRSRRAARDRRTALAHAHRSVNRQAAALDDCGDEIGRLRDAIRRLPGDRQALLALRYVDGLSDAQIAEALGVPLGTVKSRLHHARAELRSLMEGATDG